MELTPSQAIIARDLHRFRVINCGRRFGKTTEATEEIKGLALIDRNKRIKKLKLNSFDEEKVLVMSNQDEYRCRINYWAETYRDARDIAWGMLLKELGPIIIKSNDSRLEIIVCNEDGNRAIIKLRGWESVESARGTKSDFDIFDEVAKYCSFWMYWEEVIRPTLTDYIGEAMFYSTPKGFNHFYDLYNLQEKDKDFKSFHFTSFDNPFLLQSEINKAKQQMTEDRFSQEYLADFRKTQGLVYKEFSRERNIYTELGDKRMIYSVANICVGVDWGYTNPAAILKIEQDTDNRFFVSQEYYKIQRSTAELIEIAKSYDGNYYYPDPAEPDRLAEMRKAGLNVREVSKDIEAGIESVREALKTNRLFIHSSCVNLISEIETYAYPDKKPNKNEYETPIKENDHALDALRYVIHMRSQHRDSFAYVHYADSAMPTHTAPRVTDQPKVAYTHVPRL